MAASRSQVLFEAVWTSNPGKVKKELKRGACVTDHVLSKKMQEYLQSQVDSFPLLHCAALSGDPAILRSLLVAGAAEQVNLSVGGYTPAVLAILGSSKKRLECAQALVEHGARCMQYCGTGKEPS